MSIENTNLGSGTKLFTGFDYTAKAPIDSRLTVPSSAGLQALLDIPAVYPGMLVYVESDEKTYQARPDNSGNLTFTEFLSNYATKDDVSAAIGDIVFPETDLSSYAKTEDVSSAVSTAVSSIATEVGAGGTSVLAANRAIADKSGNDISSTYATLTHVSKEIAKIPSLSGYATESWVNSQGFAKGTIPTKTSQLTNDSKFMTFNDTAVSATLVTGKYVAAYTIPSVKRLAFTPTTSGLYLFKLVGSAVLMYISDLNQSSSSFVTRTASNEDVFIRYDGSGKALTFIGPLENTRVEIYRLS